MGNITFEIAGETLGLRELQVKGKDHTWHAFFLGEKPSMYGTPIQALATDLPKSVKIDGVDVYLTPDTTKDGRKKVHFSGLQTLPTLNEVKQVTVSISETKSGDWNVVAKVNRKGGGHDPESAKKKAADNLAAMRALFAN